MSEQVQGRKEETVNSQRLATISGTERLATHHQGQGTYEGNGVSGTHWELEIWKKGHNIGAQGKYVQRSVCVPKDHVQ